MFPFRPTFLRPLALLVLAVCAVAPAIRAQSYTPQPPYLVAGWDFRNTTASNSAANPLRLDSTYADVYSVPGRDAGYAGSTLASNTAPRGSLRFDGTNGSDAWTQSTARAFSAANTTVGQVIGTPARLEPLSSQFGSTFQTGTQTPLNLFAFNTASATKSFAVVVSSESVGGLSLRLAAQLSSTASPPDLAVNVSYRVGTGPLVANAASFSVGPGTGSLNAFRLVELDFTQVAALDNRPEVTFVFTLAGSASGSFRIDNLQVRADRDAGTPLVIGTHPMDTATSSGGSASFSVSATGEAPLAFQWRRNGTPLADGTSSSGAVLAGSTSSTLSLANVRAGDAGSYDVVVTAAGGAQSATSTAATLTVRTAPVFTASPSDLPLPANGDTARFTAAVDGVPAPALRWYRGSTALSDDGRLTGTTTTMLSIASPSSSDVGDYRLVATNSEAPSGVSSGTARLYGAPAFAQGLQLPSGIVGRSYASTLGVSERASFSASGIPAGLALGGSSGVLAGIPTAGGRFVVRVTALNDAGSSSVELPLTIVSEPTLTSASSVSARVGQPFVYSPTFDFQPSTLTVEGAPSWLAVDGDGRLSGTPPSGSVGGIALTFVMTNEAGRGSASVLLVVSDVPMVTSGLAPTATVGTAFTYRILATNSPVLFSAEDLPSGFALNPGTGEITGSPTSVGSFSFTVSAQNATGWSPPARVVVNVLPAGSPAIAVASEVRLPAGAAASIPVSISNSPQSVTVSGLPAGLAYDGVLGAIVGSPSSRGASSVRIEAANAVGTAVAEIRLVVIAAPEITSALQATVAVGQSFTYQIVASDAPTAFAANPLPAGLSLDGGSGLVSGTPSAEGVYRIGLSATNDAGTGTAELVLTVAGRPVVESVAAIRLGLNVPFALQLRASNTPTRFEASGLPPGLALSAVAGLLEGAPTNAGVYEVAVTASNAVGASTPERFTLEVLPTPELVPVTLPDAFEGRAYAAQLVATAASGSVAFAATDLPAGLGIDASSGLISGTPSTAFSGVVHVTLTNLSGSVVVALPLSVLARPTFAALGPQRVVAETPFSIAVSASPAVSTYELVDGDGAVRPAGLSIDAGTGLLTGSLAAGVYRVAVRATNPAGSATLPLEITAVSVPVVEGPSVQGAPLNRLVSFRIQATQSPTSYAATGLPTGLTLDAATGVISGTPSRAGVFNVALTARNEAGVSARFNLALTIDLAPTVSLASDALSAIEGLPVSLRVTTSGRLDSLVATGLPAGLSLDRANSIISGAPTETGRFTVVVTASNAAGSAEARAVIDVGSRDALVRNLYVRVLEREPTAAELEGARSLPPLALARSLFASEAFAARRVRELIGLHLVQWYRVPDAALALAQAGEVRRGARLVDYAGVLLRNADYLAAFGAQDNGAFSYGLFVNYFGDVVPVEHFPLVGELARDLDLGRIERRDALLRVASLRLSESHAARVEDHTYLATLVGRSTLPAGLSGDDLLAALLPELATRTISALSAYTAPASDAWRVSSWFGRYYGAHAGSGTGWIHAAGYGWLYAVERSSLDDGVWLWNTRHGWLWTSAAHYRHVYVHAVRAWRTVGRADDGSVWLYNHETKTWEAW